MKKISEATRDELYPIISEILDWAIDPHTPSPNFEKACKEYEELQGLLDDEAGMLIIKAFEAVNQK